MKKNLKYYILFAILVGAAFLRIYKLDQIPPSLNWDEVDAGYNAYTIANWGVDEWGHKFPLVFQSFYDDKHPVHIYIDAVFVKFIGPSDFSTRFPSAVFGVLGVAVIFFLAKSLFKKDLPAYLAAIFLAISPYHLQFSRGLWEVNFAFFFFIFGLLFFYLGKEKNHWYFPLAFLGFGLSLYSYQSSIVVVPPMIILLCILYFKDLIKNKKALIVSGLILGFFILGFALNPKLLGFARAQQTMFGEDMIKATSLFKKTGNKYLGIAQIAASNYPKYFSVDYLFLSGDQNPRNSVKFFGEFYQIDALLLLMGILAMLIKPRKEWLVLLGWIALAPIPGTLAGTTPNAARGLFIMGSEQLIAAYGLYSIVNLFKNKMFQGALVIAAFVPMLWEFSSYLNYYYTKYAKKDAIEWQYGMKQIATYIKDHPEYERVYMTKDRQQPYIFILNYLHYPVQDYLRTVVYDESQSKSYNVAQSFGIFQFSGWDPINSQPLPFVLYVLTPSQYDGLMYRSSFDIKDLIKYPDGSDAYFLVSAHESEW
ncbi:MAG: glycosyltransferase family 39 protein [Candidatus Microgenomates bacterium]|jgi:4-amino-4-deoxy-L-arabinose transferase-like glycosyltransferase